MKERKENCQSFWEEKVRAIQKVRKSVKKTKKTTNYIEHLQKRNLFLLRLRLKLYVEST